MGRLAARSGTRLDVQKGGMNVSRSGASDAISVAPRWISAMAAGAVLCVCLWLAWPLRAEGSGASPPPSSAASAQAMEDANSEMDETWEGQPPAVPAPDAQPATSAGPSPHPLAVDDPAEVAKVMADALAKQLKGTYRTHLDTKRRLVVLESADGGTSRSIRKRVFAFHDALKADLFDQPLAHPVAIVLATLKDFRGLGLPEKISGFYSERHRTLVSISLGHVIEHELVHALHHNDQILCGQSHAVWVREGLAMLYQSAGIEKGRLSPQIEGDFPALQEAVSGDKAFSLKDLSELDVKAFFEHDQVAYPQAHYVMLYLHRKGSLKDFYDAYKNRFTEDPTGLAALTEVLDAPLETVEADWRAWVVATPAPWKRGEDRKAFLGLKMRPVEQGVEIWGLLRNSPADRAKQLRVGDVLVSVAGRPTPDADAVRQALDQCIPGQTIVLEVIRKGKVVEVQQWVGGL